jgi:hypothetical protein
LQCAGSGKFPLVAQGTFAGDQLEIFVKAGEVVEAALIAQLFDAEIIFDQQLAGVANPYLDKEAGVGLSRPGFEEPAERIRADICHCCDLVQLDRPFEILQAIFVNGIDPLIFHLLEIMPEADGGEGF